MVPPSLQGCERCGRGGTPSLLPWVLTPSLRATVLSYKEVGSACFQVQVGKNICYLDPMLPAMTSPWRYRDTSGHRVTALIPLGRETFILLFLCGFLVSLQGFSTV